MHNYPPRSLSRRCFSRILLTAGLLASIPTPHKSWAADAIDRKAIQPQIDTLTIYLNRIRTLKAKVIQTNPNGYQLSGSLSLKRPGFMHLAYDEPSFLTLIANSRSLIVVDKRLEEVNYIPLSETPANFFLQRIIDLGPDHVSFLDYQSNDKSMWFDITSSEVESAGRLRIIMHKKPVSLLGWVIIEPSNQQTSIYLENLRINVPVDESLFAFSNPWD